MVTNFAWLLHPSGTCCPHDSWSSADGVFYIDGHFCKDWSVGVLVRTQILKSILGLQHSTRKVYNQRQPQSATTTRTRTSFLCEPLWHCLQTPSRSTPALVLDINTFKARGHIVPRSLTVTELDCLQCTCAWCLTGMD